MEQNWTGCSALNELHSYDVVVDPTLYCTLWPSMHPPRTATTCQIKADHNVNGSLSDSVDP